ncbi:hypothetical protein KIN20_025163 [Parelaphostrongylus tenuis]|uniref:G-protein coupled receptors family 1 profile domain-containing protein n=1 Tax=Parelaphostrongylus tenuis TaxID=148309 RepID=A0AAD5ND82_PARTN|nr:hypothetical protein KIN20_025163 [Parelaphostrongylus tenuis]
MEMTGKLLGLMVLMLSYVCVYSHLVVALNRVITIVFPLRASNALTVRNTSVVVLICWILGFVHAVPYFWASQFQTDSDVATHSTLNLFLRTVKDDQEKRIAAAPSGLDPQEVYEPFPEEMCAAFDSQDVSKLQEVVMTMDREVFSYHFQRCIDYGLWVPGPSGKEDEKLEEAEAATAEQ